MTSYPHCLYTIAGLDTETYLSQERDAMRRKHAVRKVLYLNEKFTYKEIGYIEQELYGKFKPTNHATLINSISQPYDKITQTYVKLCEDFISNQSQGAR